jgi:hypothetical protein
MLAHESGGAVVVDDELAGFVVKSVLAVSVPVSVGTFFESDGAGVVETYDEG